MTLFSYTVRYDFGFAPNPFFGFCTLATCKPRIRSRALPGDIVIGLGSKTRREHRKAIYLMRVTEVKSFDEYWSDPRFLKKRPELRGSLKVAYGDNIYHRDAAGAWLQENSHHSFRDGSCNPANLLRDTGHTEKVLISSEFSYFGDTPKPIPDEFFNMRGETLAAPRGHRCRFSTEFQSAFMTWLDENIGSGVLGAPHDWRMTE